VDSARRRCRRAKAASPSRTDSWRRWPRQRSSARPVRCRCLDQGLHGLSDHRLGPQSRSSGLARRQAPPPGSRARHGPAGERSKSNLLLSRPMRRSTAAAAISKCTSSPSGPEKPGSDPYKSARATPACRLPRCVFLCFDSGAARIPTASDASERCAATALHSLPRCRCPVGWGGGGLESCVAGRRRRCCRSGFESGVTWQWGPTLLVCGAGAWTSGLYLIWPPVGPPRPAALPHHIPPGIARDSAFGTATHAQAHRCLCVLVRIKRLVKDTCGCWFPILVLPML